jgi:hypothetical protein
MNRVAKSSENAASPAPREAVKKRAVPITMPPPANAPKMPSTRPRTSGVPPMYFQPSTNCRTMLCSAFFCLRWRLPALISRIPKNTTRAVARRDRALM